MKRVWLSQAGGNQRCPGVMETQVKYCRSSWKKNQTKPNILILGMQSIFNRIETIRASECSTALNKQSETWCRTGTFGNTPDSPGYMLWEVIETMMTLSPLLESITLMDVWEEGLGRGQLLHRHTNNEVLVCHICPYKSKHLRKLNSFKQHHLIKMCPTFSLLGLKVDSQISDPALEVS